MWNTFKLVLATVFLLALFFVQQKSLINKLKINSGSSYSSVLPVPPPAVPNL